MLEQYFIVITAGVTLSSNLDKRVQIQVMATDVLFYIYNILKKFNLVLPRIKQELIVKIIGFMLVFNKIKEILLRYGLLIKKNR